MDHLRTRAVALTCPGFVRVFASHHASIQENAEGSIQTFGIYLTPKEEEECDMIEGLGDYYDKVTVPVIMHREGRPDEESTANVYRMTQSTVDDEV